MSVRGREDRFLPTLALRTCLSLQGDGTCEHMLTVTQLLATLPFLQPPLSLGEGHGPSRRGSVQVELDRRAWFALQCLCWLCDLEQVTYPF